MEKSKIQQRINNLSNTLNKDEIKLNSLRKIAILFLDNESRCIVIVYKK